MVNEKTYLSASAVMRAGWDLRDALADPARLALATDRLASAAEQSLAQLDDVATMAFQSAGRAVTVERADSSEELLAAALSQVEVANTLLAASRAVGEQGDAEPAELDGSLRRLDGTITMLRSQDQLAVQGFQAEARTLSSTVDEAVATLGKQLGTTVDAVITRSTGVIGKAITGIHSGGPDVVTKAWNWVNERVNLDEIGGKLVRLGMRALHAALGLLLKVFPTERLRAIRADVQNLIDEISDGPAGHAVVGAVLGAPQATEDAMRALEKSDLDRARLDGATDELITLAARHDKQLELWNGLGTAIGYARTFAMVVRLAIPYLGVIILAAHLVVVGAVVVIGRERVGDAGTIITGAAG